MFLRIPTSKQLKNIVTELNKNTGIKVDIGDVVESGVIEIYEKSLAIFSLEANSIESTRSIEAKRKLMDAIIARVTAAGYLYINEKEEVSSKSVGERKKFEIARVLEVTGC